MDLFADEYYELDSLNKINYYKVLYDPTTTLTGNYVKTINDTDFTVIEQTLTNVVLLNSIDHISKTDTDQMCYEVQITDTIKKIILE